MDRTMIQNIWNVTRVAQKVEKVQKNYQLIVLRPIKRYSCRIQRIPFKTPFAFLAF